MPRSPCKATHAVQCPRRYQVEPNLAGRTLELRFDPFDLSQIELWQDGADLGLATVVIQNRQRHLAVEHLATEPPEPPKPKSSLDYFAALCAGAPPGATHARHERLVPDGQSEGTRRPPDLSRPGAQCRSDHR